VQRAILILNPGAGGGGGDGRKDRIIELLSAGLALEIHVLAEGESALGPARAAIARGVDVVIAAGGDGTVSMCADAVLGSPTHLGIVPCGTSNSIARALGLPVDLDAACAAIVSGGVRAIDAARVDGRAMVLLASIGFHADTIDSTTSESKNALGKLAYVLRGIQRLAEFESFDATIETERGSANVRAMALTIANFAPPETLFAQGAPSLAPDDGWLDLTVASAETALEAVAAGIELAVSSLTTSAASGPHVGWVRCTRVRVTASPPQNVLVDGDVVGTTPIDVVLVPRGLAIRVAV
jgi:YegS/Rv2252/BmrU family lipid kinase